MRALVQRVSAARVDVAGQTIGQIEAGLVVLICAMADDGADHPAQMAAKIAKLRIFKDDAGRMNRSILDTGGSVLVVSQFTLAADTRSGNRPSFATAAPAAIGRDLYLRFITALRDLGLRVATGEFGADMQLHLSNDGPVTIWMEI